MSYRLTQYTTVQKQLCCPFCQQIILKQHVLEIDQTCSHLLFVALDIGFEYISTAFEQQLNVSVDDLHEQDCLNVEQIVTECSFQNVQLVKSPLGMANLQHYLCFYDDLDK